MRSLQCARAVAALLVVYFHTVIQLRHLWSQDGPHFILFGQSGVDVFFVLSGFLMWHSTRGGAYPALLFYKKRIARIVPLYWTVTLAAATIAVLIPSVLKSTRFDVAHLLASLAFVPWPNPAAHANDPITIRLTPVVVPGWTLDFEMMFYAVFGLALIGPRRHRLSRMAVLFAGSITMVTILRPSFPAVGFYDPFLIGEFLLGVVIGVAVERGLRLPPKSAIVLLAGAMLVLLALDLHPPPGSRLLRLGLPAMLIIFSLVSIELAGRWPRLVWLGRLGDASFSIYLTHIFVLAALRVLWTAAQPQISSGMAAPFFLGAGLLASAAVGLCVYRCVEQPLGEKANRLLGLRRRADDGGRGAAALPASPVSAGSHP